MRRKFIFEDSDGIRLNAYKWVPERNVIGIVQLAHGMAESILRYDEFANYLNSKGFIVYGHDHRGHGLTAYEEEKLGYIADDEGFEWIVEDLYQINRSIKIQYPDLPIYLLGHSMGSFVSQRFAELHGDQIDGLILIGSNGKPQGLISLGILLSKLEIMILGRKHTSKMMDSLCFKNYNKEFRPNRTSFDWICSVNEEVDKYIEDKYCGFVCSASFYYDLLRGLKTIHKKANFNCIPKELPILILSGDKDPVGNYGKGVINLYDKLKEFGVNDVQYKLYKGKRHELLNEDNKQEIMNQISEWILNKNK